MPREVIDLPTRVEYLSILDEDAKLDAELEPDLPDELLVKLYRTMVTARRLDARMLDLQREGRLGTFAPVKGQEASQVGAIATLGEGDWMIPSFRETAAALWRGQPMHSILLYYGGNPQGNESLEGTHNLPAAIPVATQVVQAAGIGYGIKYRGRDEVAMVFFGDGATSEGDFYEALNFAGVFQTPVVFLCQNNQWAISLPRSEQTRSKTLAQKAIAAGVPGIQVDGNDVLAVYAAAQEAVERARNGEGPTMIECVTYRLSLHTTADDPTRYRDEEEVKQWEQRDPIPRFERYLVEKGLLSEDQIASIAAEVDDEIEDAVERYEEQRQKLSDQAQAMFDHVYAERSPYLEEQRQEFLQLSGRQEEDAHA
jgi:pyruvate dehydrogenase E1 component alpha subunit